MQAVKRKKRIERAVFVTQAKSFSPVHSAKGSILQAGDVKSLGCLSIVRFNELAELLLTANSTLSHWNEIFLENGVIPSNAAMRALGQIMRAQGLLCWFYWRPIVSAAVSVMS